MAEPVIENQIQDGGFRLPPLSNALCLRGHAHFRLLRHRHGCFGDPALRRCPEATLQRVGSGWQPVETPGLAANPSGYGPLTELPDWSYAETSCTAVTGNGCWNTGMAAQTAEVAGRRKETEKCS
ncbi:large ribosomal subunit protein mL52 isoform X4 [Ictidomys tridecemlineatus]